MNGLTLAAILELVYPSGLVQVTRKARRYPVRRATVGQPVERLVCGEGSPIPVSAFKHAPFQRSVKCISSICSSGGHRGPPWVEAQVTELERPHRARPCRLRRSARGFSYSIIAAIVHRPRCQQPNIRRRHCKRVPQPTQILSLLCIHRFHLIRSSPLPESSEVSSSTSMTDAATSKLGLGGEVGLQVCTLVRLQVSAQFVRPLQSHRDPTCPSRP